MSGTRVHPEEEAPTRKQPEIRIHPETDRVLETISGPEIEQGIIELAQIGGTQIEPSKELPQRFAVNRLALSKEDKLARAHLKSQMETAGMTVEEHPLGLIGTYEGSQPELPAIGMMSHFDSVPEAGMYDGTTGVISAIHIVRKLKEQGITPKKTIKVIAVTGEESARFNIALFGSKGMFQGLTDQELDMADKKGTTMRQALINLGYDPRDVTKPFLNKTDFQAIIEFHVAQDRRYPDKLVVVDAIAAPERYKLDIGREALEPLEHKPNDIFMNLRINGVAGHSGATPMGELFRTDGLIISSRVLQTIINLNKQLYAQGNKNQIAIGDCLIHGEAMNKIPGIVDTPICITGENPESVVDYIYSAIQTQQEQLKKTHGRDIVVLTHSKQPEEPFFDPQILQVRQEKAFAVIETINRIANDCSDHKCVGTVSTFHIKEGKIDLGIDLRGIDHTSRQRMIAQMKKAIRAVADLKFSPPLPGSGEPVRMCGRLVRFAEDLISKLEIAPFITSFSAAGHDIQNPSRAGVKSLLLFCPSPNGVAHNPDEYSSPQHLEWGAKALAALVLYLTK